jgi:L-ascorbate metabolism protein UlaG (beta-lactamase superfamily)
MQLYAEVGIDVAMLPIGDNFTMGPEDAVKAVGFLQPKTAILMHYNTFGIIAQDAQAAADEIEAKAKIKAVILQPGETLVVT